MKTINVRSRVTLTKPAEERHVDVMRAAANTLTNDCASVRAFVSPENNCAVVAEFTMNKARQVDVVDRIMREFAMYMHDYSTQDVWFPKTKASAPK